MSYFRSGPPRGRGNMHRGGSSTPWNSGGRGRGKERDYSPRRSSSSGMRGRGGWNNRERGEHAPSYNDHSRGSRDQGSVRYSMKDRDDGYRKYKPETSSYHDDHRKRPRYETNFNQASSHHRGHEHSSSSGAYDSYTSSTSRYSGGGSSSHQDVDYNRSEKASYREHPSSFAYVGRRDDRYHDPRINMPPPPPPPPPHSPPKYSSSSSDAGRSRRIISRNNVISSRTSAALRLGSDKFVRRRTLLDSSYAIKKRERLVRSARDKLRLLQIQKIRRLKENVAIVDKEDSDSKRYREQRERSADRVIKPEKSEKASESVAVERNVEDDSKKEPDENQSAINEETKISDIANQSVQVTITQNSEGRNVSDEKSHKSSSPRPHIYLLCPICHHEYDTFKQYANHLTGSRHNSALRNKRMVTKQTILRLRAKQRTAQREKERDESQLAKFTSFCNTCKLNYRQDPDVHKSSSMHKEMNSIINPRCKVCDISFRASLIYDRHICSLDHIKRAASKPGGNEKSTRSKRERHNSDGDTNTMDLNDFVVLDSVGDDDDNIEDLPPESPAELKKEPILGPEFVKTVSALYCELCERFLPRLDDKEKALDIHCSSSQHIRLYHKEKRRTKDDSIENKTNDEAENKEDKTEGENGMEKSEENADNNDKSWDNSEDKTIIISYDDGKSSDEESNADNDHYGRFRSENEENIKPV